MYGIDYLTSQRVSPLNKPHFEAMYTKSHHVEPNVQVLLPDNRLRSHLWTYSASLASQLRRCRHCSALHISLNVMNIRPGNVLRPQSMAQLSMNPSPHFQQQPPQQQSKQAASPNLLCEKPLNHLSLTLCPFQITPDAAVAATKTTAAAAAAAAAGTEWRKQSPPAFLGLADSAARLGTNMPDISVCIELKRLEYECQRLLQRKMFED
ncbi:hypothetical protein F4604DRAFT_1678225 [Suillus subluteus]|nr:hypothetical protein F4604DRAFT_1678225 [Suillus subluteus]